MSELKHYGVKGMKWGVRTAAYTKNRVGDYYTDRQKKKMTKSAVKIYSRRRNNAETLAKSEQNSSNKAYEKADIERAKMHADRAKQYTKQAEIYNTVIRDIASGKVQAGRDYVVNSVYSTNLALDAIGWLNVRREQRIDYA